MSKDPAITDLDITGKILDNSATGSCECADITYTVWFGGTNSGSITNLKDAIKLAEWYESKGYDDVQIERLVINNFHLAQIRDDE